MPPSKPIPGKSLADLYPEIAVEADGWDPTAVRPASNRKLLWRCSLGHGWVTSPLTRTSGSGCPTCVGKVVLPGFNDLASANPQLAAEADGWDPTSFTAHSSKKVPWRCSVGHTWITRIAERSAGTGCPFCNRRALLTGFNDLGTEYPEIAAEADGWDPTLIMPRTSKKLPWVCSVGHRWVTTPADRTGGKGCPTCAGRSVLSGFNDIATTHPEVAANAYGWDPATVSKGSNAILQFICTEGHITEMRVADRVRTPRCQVCSGKQALAGYNDLATEYPELAAEAYGWDPTTLRPGSNVKVGWECSLGHRWESTIINRALGGNGCPVCVGRKVLAGFNDLATTHPDIANEAVDWDTTLVTRGSKAHRLWRCSEGHEWRATVGDRTAGYGCPTCAPSGYDPARDAYIYLIEDDERGMLQVGITNTPELRLQSHGRGGWTPIDLRGPMDGAFARATEKAILKAIKSRGAVMAPTTGTQQFDGWTEAWLRDTLRIEKIRELLDLVDKDENPS